jgi:DHA2 family multidrug resistance protein
MVFYLGVVPGVVMLAALIYALPHSHPRLDLLWKGDWTGIVLMATGLAALQTVLDEGNVYDWFGCPFIVKLSLISAVALSTFIAVELVRKEPLVNLRLLVRRNFGFGTASNFLLGFALYASAYLLPQYLAVSQGLSAQQSGEVMAWTGLPQLVVIPLVPLVLMRWFDPRLLVGFGLAVFAASCFLNLYMDPDYAAPQLFIPDVTRAFG